MNSQYQELLSALCKTVYDAQAASEQEYKREMFGNQFIPELLVRRVDSIKIEIRKETISHHEPHMHITHSDKIDVSLCLTDFRVLAGAIDNKTLKKLKPILNRCKPYLIQIWDALNVENDSLKAVRLIANLP